MGSNSKIEWCDHTFNPWWGCSKVSEGCKNCYAEAWAHRLGNDLWGKDKDREIARDGMWKMPIAWNQYAINNEIRYKVFCGSMCDIFEANPALESSQRRLGELIRETPYLDWLLLTKRPENIMKMYKIFDFMHWIQTGPDEWDDDQIEFPDNVWLGVSVENQEQANIRIPLLRKFPAKIRFLSMEPLLEPINFHEVGRAEAELGHEEFWPLPVDWVIVGGESGPHRRPFELDWARDILAQCRKAGVPFFMKQVDKIIPIPEDLFIREYPEVPFVEIP